MEAVRATVHSLDLTLVFGSTLVTGLLLCGLVFVFGGDAEEPEVRWSAAATRLGLLLAGTGALGLTLYRLLGVTPLRSVALAAISGLLLSVLLDWALRRLLKRS